MPDDADSEMQVTKRVVELLLEGKSVAQIFLDDNIEDVTLERISEIELMVRNEQPLVKMDTNGTRASVLNYDVPASTSYIGLYYLNLRRPKLNEESNYEWFQDLAKK